MNKWIALSSVLVCSLVMIRPGRAIAEGAAPSKRDYVVLLHGYGRTSVSMKRMQWYLQKHGYRVINACYPSTRFPVEKLSDIYLRQLLETKITDRTATVHFVTHSLGGILLRQYVTNHEIANLGRVVMLAPPNAGSELVDRMGAHPFCRRFVGLARLQLGTSPEDLPRRLGPARFELGVIAGDRPINPLLAHLLPGPNDGKVTMASAKLDGMKDFAVVHSSHTWLMWREQTLSQTLRFLETGSFAHDGPGGAQKL